MKRPQEQSLAADEDYDDLGDDLGEEDERPAESARGKSSRAGRRRQDSDLEDEDSEDDEYPALMSKTTDSGRGSPSGAPTEDDSHKRAIK